MVAVAAVAVVVVPVVATKAGPACIRVKTVSTGWHVQTAIAPDAQPAIKSTHASERDDEDFDEPSDEDISLLKKLLDSFQ